MKDYLEILQNFSYTTDESYRGDMSAISSHFLMSFINNNFKKEDAYGYKPYFAQGHLLEALIFDENIDKVLSEEFLLLEFEPAETLQRLISIYAGSNFPHALKSREDQKKELIKLIGENNLWKSTKKIELLYDKFNYDEFWSYLDNMFALNPKKIISSDQYMVIEEAADKVKNLKIIKDIPKLAAYKEAFYFIHPMYKTTVSIEEYKFLARAQYDLIVYYPKENKVVITDFKTTSNSAGNFIIDYKKYKYFLQSYWYVAILREILGNNINIEFNFVVVSKTRVDESALVIKDDLACIFKPSEHPLLKDSHLFKDINTAINKKKFSLEFLTKSSNSPKSLIHDFNPSISDLLF